MRLLKKLLHCIISLRSFIFNGITNLRSFIFNGISILRLFFLHCIINIRLFILHCIINIRLFIFNCITILRFFNLDYIFSLSFFLFNYISLDLNFNYLNSLGLKELFNAINKNSLNSIWVNSGISDFSILFCLKIFFFTLFIIFNIWLVYIEYLDKKETLIYNTPLQSGLHPTIQRAAKGILYGLGAVSGFIAIKNEYLDLTKESTKKAIEAKIAQIISDLIQARKHGDEITDTQIRANFFHKVRYKALEINIGEIREIINEESELIQILKAQRIDWSKSQDPNLLGAIVLGEAKLKRIALTKEKKFEELNQDVKIGQKFVDVMCKQTDEKKVIAMLTDEDIKNSVIFSFNVDKLWNIFETLDGIHKLVWLMLFSSYLISSCVFGILINLYGNFLLSRFKLEERYPKLAIFIKYRQKISKYYILLNLFMILFVCGINFILGFSILSL